MVVASTTLCARAMRFYSSMCSFLSETLANFPPQEESLEHMETTYEKGKIYLVVLHDYFFFGMDLQTTSDRAEPLKYVRESNNLVPNSKGILKRSFKGDN